MSVTAAQAWDAVQDRLNATGSGISIALHYQGDDPPVLPDTPAAFAFVLFNVQGSGGAPAAFGGGAGANLYRNRALIEAFVFSPNGEGLSAVMTHAETVAARLRSFRSTEISCFAADVVPVGDGSKIAPPGLASPVNNYQCAVVECTAHFDQIG